MAKKTTQKKAKPSTRTHTAPVRPVVPELAGAEELYAIAMVGERRLTPKERRRVMVWLDSLRYSELGKPYRTTSTLASLFEVGESAIADDRKAIAAAYAKTLTPDQAMSLVGRYLRSHDRLLAGVEAGLDQALPGGQRHCEYLKLYSDLTSRQIKLAQEIGLIRKELGHLQVSEEVWVATTSAEGVTTVSQQPTQAPIAGDGQSSAHDEDADLFTD